ncbi:glycoside hydrolase family 3 protein [Sphingobacterium litopenaei]|uniref:beta-N-acetylhexosaminidase n=1 Tax=Sphingobacterium litopenaei TaxID=2763500 RepID=A0ABR7YGR7_9SPHI|nr:glycoside hydrolase family 3 N-terminal domain-containing protein [Sphingobacterium litopenaei]MBD1430509.1 glycoside hydrolase family 3 [Sphingobacterium litopenaei]
MLKPILAFSLALMTSLGAVAQKRPDFVRFINSNHKWVDSVFNSLTPKERIGQLFLVRAHTNLGQKFIDSVGTVIKNEQLGGLVVFQGGPVRHVDMINKYQKVSKVPLLVTIDGEWGLGMRLPDSTQSFPYQMTLGALQDNSLIYDMGRDAAKDFLRLGIHFNFAPTVDINNNPKNPVIGFRSFGDNKENVAVKSAAYMKGMIDGGVLASIKHFPGHGDTDVDSHYDLPKLPFTRERLEELEMYPFRELIKQGATAVMVGHMDIPALDNTPNLPSSISKKVVTDLLRKQLGFQGLTVTDAMNMKGVTKFFPNGEADILAIEAGHDLLELSENSARAIALVEKSIQSGRLKQADIDARVKRVLAAKLWLGLDKYAAANRNRVFDDINRPETKSLIQRMADGAVTVLKSNRRIQSFDAKKETVVVSVGISKAQDFESGLSARLTNVKNIYISGKETEAQLEELVKEVRSHEQIVLAIHDDRSRPRPALDFSKDVNNFIDKIAGRRTITVLLTNPYAITSVKVDRSASIIMGYQNEAFMQRAAVKVLLKDIKSKGKLPVSINKTYAYGKGL